jgi:hypothetical protein
VKATLLIFFLATGIAAGIQYRIAHPGPLTRCVTSMC